MNSAAPESVKTNWPWPPSLDALVAAPENHTLLMENDKVRVVETRIGPGRRSRCIPIAGHACCLYYRGAI